MKNFFHHIDDLFLSESKLLELSLRNDNHATKIFISPINNVASAVIIHFLFPFVRQAFWLWFLQRFFIPFQSATNLNFRSSKFKTQIQYCSIDFRFSMLYERLSLLFKRSVSTTTIASKTEDFQEPTAPKSQYAFVNSSKSMVCFFDTNTNR
jgi:hypothetical protein